MRTAILAGVLIGAALLSGCYPRGNPEQPIPTTLVPASTTAQRLIVVLPGRGDDLEDLQQVGIAGVVQSAWPDSDVELTGLTLGYYEARNAEQRLHDEVIAPARAHGYREIWLLGVSLGGTGALLYDRAHPDVVEGIVLLSPYTGDKPLLAEITAAGGVARWTPGPVPAAVGRDNFQRELWRHVQSWSRDPASTTRVWLGYGTDDRLAEGFALLRPVLQTDHVIVVDGGGHNWDTWRRAAREILVKARRDAPAAPQRSP